MTSESRNPRPQRDSTPLCTEHLQAIVDAMPVPVSWARLRDGRIVFWNRAFTHTFGYAFGELETVPEWVEAVTVNPEDRAEAERSWFGFFEAPVAREIELDPVEIEVRCKDGTVKTVILGGVILPQEDLMVATFPDISERKLAERVFRQFAEEDALTGLANRRGFDARLQQFMDRAVGAGSPVHLLILDLDRFKAVNDTHGHPGGDAVLKAAARRIEETVRTGDGVARLGGDEFAVLLTDRDGEVEVARVCEHLLAALSQPVEGPGGRVEVSVSIGASGFPRDANDAHGLFQVADQALYRAKEGGRGQWRYGEADQV